MEIFIWSRDHPCLGNHLFQGNYYCSVFTPECAFFQLTGFILYVSQRNIWHDRNRSFLSLHCFANSGGENFYNISLYDFALSAGDRYIGTGTFILSGAGKNKIVANRVVMDSAYDILCWDIPEPIPKMGHFPWLLRRLEYMGTAICCVANPA